jgi:hypothetical protein
VLYRPPLALPEPKPGDTCIHLLTKSNECLFALWACKSLLDQLEQPIPLFIHDDGSLTRKDVQLFEAALPGVQVVQRDEADALARQSLDGLPNCLRFRKSNILSLKLFDPWIVQETGDIILLDSDVLFFRRPLELIHWLERPEERRTRWNMDWTCNAEMQGKFVPTRQDEYPSPVPGFNSGLGFLRRDLMSFETIEDLLSRGYEGKTKWAMEQKLYGRLSACVGMEALPPTYHVAIETVTPPHGLVAKHYVGMVRGYFIAEGIWWLLNRAECRDSRGEHVKA